MSHLGNIQINHSQAYIMARKKLHALVELFTGDSLAALRLAAATSQICRAVYRESSQWEIGVDLSQENGQTTLILDIESSQLDDPIQYADLFFDHLERRKKPDGALALKLFKHLKTTGLTQTTIDQAREILLHKTRDELIAEVRNKNLELQNHQENLERTVRVRTQELEDASRKMQASEERTRLILESVGEGIFGVDKEGRLNFINEAGLSMLGFNLEEIQGQKVHTLTHHTRADGSAYPVEECPMYHSYTQGVTEYRDDEVLWRKDGSSFPVEYTSKPVLKNGGLAGSVVVFRDITARREAEEELRANQETLSKITSSALSAIIMLDAETGKVSFWNETAVKIFGWSFEEVRGKVSNT